MKKVAKTMMVLIVLCGMIYSTNLIDTSDTFRMWAWTYQQNLYVQ